jgi:hypothetical protein
LEQHPRVAPDNDVDMDRIELDRAARPPSVLDGEQSRPGAEEWVENNFRGAVSALERSRLPDERV